MVKQSRKSRQFRRRRWESVHSTARSQANARSGSRSFWNAQLDARLGALRSKYSWAGGPCLTIQKCSGTPGLSHLGTRETTNYRLCGCPRSLAVGDRGFHKSHGAKCRPPGRQALADNYPTSSHNDPRSLPSNHRSCTSSSLGAPRSLAFGDLGDHAEVAGKSQNVP